MITHEILEKFRNLKYFNPFVCSHYPNRQLFHTISSSRRDLFFVIRNTDNKVKSVNFFAEFILVSSLVHSDTFSLITGVYQ